MANRFGFISSGVVFTDNPHGYHKDGKEYSGITSLIHAVKALGVYPNASDFVKNYTIPKAGAYGTSVHDAIEFFDTMGIKKTEWQTRFGIFNVEEELENYIALKKKGGYENEENEFNVAYGDYSSNIDNIWSKDGEIYLVDTKTNNLDYYPNGEEGLKEYLMWQLNCYRVMFEMQNPHIKVKGLLANHLRKGDGVTWDIPMIDDEAVIELLNTKCEVNADWAKDNNEPRFRYYTEEDGAKVYYDAEEKKNELSTIPSDLIIPNDVVENMRFIESQMNHYKEMYDNMKNGLLKVMSEKGIKSFDCGALKATITPETTSKSFDKDKFFKAHPELKDEIPNYEKTTTRKASIRLTFRD